MKETPDTIKHAADDDQQQSPDGPTHQPNPGTNASSDATEDTLDFVVTEAHAQSSDLVGGYQEAEDDLGIESNSDLMERGAAAIDSDMESTTPYAGKQIGDSNPPLPTPSQSES